MTHPQSGTACELLILPDGASTEQVVSLRARRLSLSRAVKYVMEELPPDERERAVIRTPVHLVYPAEIAALYNAAANPSSERMPSAGVL